MHNEILRQIAEYTNVFEVEECGYKQGIKVTKIKAPSSDTTDISMQIEDVHTSYELELLPMIQEKCIRNKQDVFIENALHFFMRSSYNCCDWIMGNYSQFQSEYLRCMLCLVLGLRGDIGMIPFLIEEAKRMEKEYPDETYDQGPTLAVHELAKILFKEE